MPSLHASAASLLAVLCVAGAASPSVTVSNGTVVGGICAKNPNAVYYKSIPFAQPPTGALRFLPSQPYAQQYPGGTLNATSRAPICVQFDGPRHSEGSPGQEDCLYLDVWAPANATADSALPVRVWLYGGSNVFGGVENPLYDGCNVPDTDAIMVALNYRVGPLGFLAAQGTQIVGNQAMQDMLLGLQWVQDNIAAFGGDAVSARS